MPMSASAPSGSQPRPVDRDGDGDGDGDEDGDGDGDGASASTNRGANVTSRAVERVPSAGVSLPSRLIGLVLGPLRGVRGRRSPGSGWRTSGARSRTRRARSAWVDPSVSRRYRVTGISM